MHRPVFSSPACRTSRTFTPASARSRPASSSPGTRTSCRRAIPRRWRRAPFGGDIVGRHALRPRRVRHEGRHRGLRLRRPALSSGSRRAAKGSIAFLITGDEEGPAVNGTVKLLAWAQERGERFDDCILGEPTNPDALGDMIKIGRRGSLTGRLTVEGKQGHVGYPHLADNPIRGMTRLLAALQEKPLDAGTAHFCAVQPRNHDGGCRQRRDKRHSGVRPRHVQRSLQRPLDGRVARRRDPPPSRRRRRPGAHGT